MSNEEIPFTTTFKEKIDMSQLWLMHANRTNMASGNVDGLYDPYVSQGFRLLPSNMQTWVLNQEDEYTEKKHVFNYESDGGIRLGSEFDPLLYEDLTPVKRLPDGSIDWEDPNIMSPKRELKKIYDYEKFNLFIMLAAEKAGLSWNIKIHTYDDGDVKKKSKKKQSQHPLKKTSSGQIYADIPVGFDTRIISSTHDPDYNIIDWHGTRVIEGPGYGPLFFDMINARTNAENGTIIGIGGAPGIGKTYFGERLGEIINRIQPHKKFNPYLQIPFTQEHMLWLLSEDSPLELGDVIVLDEAHFAGGARNWFKEDQKEFVDMIASARNMGLIIILVVLHMSMLDKILRQFTMAFYIHLEQAGKATAYETFTPRFDSDMFRVTIGFVTLQLPGVSSCDHPRCLHCVNLLSESEFVKMCFNIRSIYERRKKIFQNAKVAASMERRKQKKEKSRPDSEYLDLVRPFWNDGMDKKANVETKDNQIRKMIQEKYDVSDVSNRLVTRIRKLLQSES